MPNAPYDNPPVGASYARLIPPKNETDVGQVAAALFSSHNQSEVMLQVTDWARYGESEMPPSLQVAEAAIPHCPPESVGIVFEIPEAASAGDCCTFIVASGMSAYLYFPDTKISTYLWEGDFVELWGPSKSSIIEISDRLERAGCKVVT